MKSMRAPFTDGADLWWAVAWLLFIAVVALLTVFLKPGSLTRLSFASIGIIATVLLVLSHTVIPAIVAAIILLVSTGCGECALRIFDFGASTGLPDGDLVERFSITLPIGFGLLALTQLAFGLLGFFNRAASWSILAACAIPAIVGWRSLIPRRFAGELFEHPLITAPMAWIFLINAIWAIAPEIQFDPLNVHLAVPRIYLQHGQIVDLPYFMHSYFVHLLDTMFGLCLATGGPHAAKLIILGLGVVAAGGVFAIGRRLFNSEVGIWSALIFYSIPQVIWLSGTAYVDLAETAFIIGAILAFLRWWDTGEIGWLVATAWITGVAAGTKLHALTLLAPLPLAIAWHSRTRWKSSAVRVLGIFILTAVVVAGPWYAVIYAFTANPVFPFMNAVFRSPQWDIENTRLDADAFGIGVSPSKIIRLPFWLTWDTIRFGVDLPRGGLGFALLLALPFAFIAPFWQSRFRAPVMAVLLCCIGLFFVLWALSFQYGRYFVAALPLVTVLGSALFLSVPSPFLKLNRILLFTGVLIQAPLASLMSWQISDRVPLGYALGRETDQNFLSRAVPGFAAAQYVNRVIQPGQRVLGIGLDQLRFYLNAPLDSLGEASRGQVLHGLPEVKEDSAIAGALSKVGIAYIITPLADLRKPAEYYPWLQSRFVDRFETQVYSDRTVAVLKLCSASCRQE
jgi:hypothetical protein